MQNYNNHNENIASIGSISGYMMLKLNLYQVELMSKRGISIDDARYIPMFEEYLSLRMDGAKKKQTMEYLAKKYFVSVSTVKRVVARLSEVVTP